MKYKYNLELWDSTKPKYGNGGYPGMVFKRDYASMPALNRALPAATRAHPTAVMAIVTAFEWRSWCWLAGQSGERRYRCPHRDGWLDWCVGQFICPKCGDEWDEETIYGH